MIHLHLHTEYSQLDGLGNPDKYCQKAAELGQKAIAITDHGNIDGVIQFQKAADKYRLKSILGCELYVVPDIAKKDKSEKRLHLTALIKDESGWMNLCKMLSIANLKGFYRRPRVDFNILSEHKEGLVFLSGCAFGILNCIEGNQWFLNEFGHSDDCWFFEVMPHDSIDQKKYNELNLELNELYPFGLVATNDCHYVNKEDSTAQEVLLAIQRRAKWNDKNRWKFDIDGLHLRTEKEMQKAFISQGVLSKKQINEAIKNTHHIADLCNFRIEKQKPSLPQITGDLRGLYTEGYSKIFGKDKVFSQDVLQRLKYEYGIIKRKNFDGYFLIVKDIIDFCKKENILTGIGRGSVGGSFIAYLLGITAVNPLEYDLIFERFLTKNRIDYPDIDLDFEHNRRDEVKQYIQNKYGENNVASVSTFIRLKTKAVIRDVMRVFDFSNEEINRISKDLESLSDLDNTDFGKDNPEILKIAKTLENTIKSSGQHAAGVIISNNPLTESGQGNLAIRSGNPCINWEMNDCEYMGLIKFDILGLDALSILNMAKRLIGKDFDLKKIPMDDEQVFKEFSAGNTIAIFQFSGYGMTDFLRKLNPTCFEDLIAANALYRPGTLHSGMTDIYIERKNGKKYELDERLKPILGKTYGIMVYQEQIMSVSQIAAGFSSENSDKLRKVIAKSKGYDEIQKWEDQFISGCNKNGFNGKQLWDEIVEFAKYGFNKSHSVEYSTIGYWMMWLKTNYPKEFMLSVLTFCSDSVLLDNAEEAKRLGFQISCPKDGISKAKEWVEKDNILYAPYISIKGIGEKEAEKAEIPNKKIGFFNTRKPTKTNELFKSAGVFSDDFEQDLFEFTPSVIKKEINIKDEYPELYKLFPDIFSVDIDDILKGELTPETLDKKLIKKRRIKSEKFECDKCKLQNNPVETTPGLYNVFVINEYSDKNKESDDLLWGSIGIDKRNFHISNIIRCKSENATKTQIEICKQKTFEEMQSVKCRLALVFGDIGLKAFTGKSGINKMSGDCMWSEQAHAWIVFCTNHADVLENKLENEKYFIKGIEKFLKTFEMML